MKSKTMINLLAAVILMIPVIACAQIRSDAGYPRLYDAAGKAVTAETLYDQVVSSATASLAGLDDKVDRAGDTMTGTLIVNKAGTTDFITLRNTSSDSPTLRFQNAVTGSGATDGPAIGLFGQTLLFSQEAEGLFYFYGATVFEESGGVYLNNTLTTRLGYDAGDMVLEDENANGGDPITLSALYAGAGLTGIYVQVAGDTMTGTLQAAEGDGFGITFGDGDDSRIFGGEGELTFYDANVGFNVTLTDLYSWNSKAVRNDTASQEIVAAVNGVARLKLSNYNAGANATSEFEVASGLSSETGVSMMAYPLVANDTDQNAMAALRGTTGANGLAIANDSGNPVVIYAGPTSEPLNAKLQITQRGLNLPSGGTQTIVAAGNSIAATHSMVLLDVVGGPIVLTSTPHMTVGAAGDIRIIINSDAEDNSLTFQDEDSVPGTLMQLEAATVTLGQHDALTVMSDGTYWIQITPVGNN